MTLLPNSYIIVDLTRSNDTLVYWNPDRMGYTTQLEKAGHYNVSDCKEICEGYDRDNIYLDYDVMKKLIELLPNNVFLSIRSSKKKN